MVPIGQFLVYKNNAAELVLTISKNNCYNNSPGLWLLTENKR